MRTKLFNLVGSFGENFIDVLSTVLQFFVNVHTTLSDWILRGVAHSFKFVLWLIDRRRTRYTEQVILQSDMSTELEILMMVSKVKEDALNIGFWRENHSMALNELGSRLYNECEWEESDIHRYMKMIVESIPGLTYATSDDVDDEDEGIPLEDR
jgi:hypothetical protein